VNIETVTEKLRGPHHFSFRVSLQADLLLCIRDNGTPCLWDGGKPFSEREAFSEATEVGTRT
jgi:hypothetical protein